MIDFIALDFETTGFDPTRADVIEIGAARYRNSEEVETFSTLVFPPRGVPRWILAKTGIAQEALAEAPAADAVIPAFLDFLGDETIIVAHQAAFERKFLAVLTDVARFTFIDTLALARRIRPDLPNHRLAVVADALGLTVGHGHRALEDARLAGEIFLRLSAGGEDVQTMGAVLRHRKTAPPIRLRVKAAGPDDHIVEHTPVDPGARTIDALRSGMTVEELARVEGITPGSVEKRIERLIAERRLAVEALLSAERIAAVQTLWARADHDAPLKAVAEASGGSATWRELRWVRAALVADARREGSGAME